MKGTARRVIWIAALTVLAIVGVAAFRFGPAPLDTRGRGINVLERIDLGGIKQWISIQGTDAANPVLLFLHGGPGSAKLSKLRIQCPALLEHFVVVNWDQRGAGKTGGPLTAPDASGVDMLRRDAHELVLHLRQRFAGKKIYLLGFSWGTVLGLWTARDYPEGLAAFISVGQVVSPREGEKLSLEFTQRTARESGNEKAARELADIDPAYSTGDWFGQLMRQRKWLLAFGGVYRSARSYAHEASMLLKAPEYSFVDFALWPLRCAASLKTTWPELMSVDFFQSARGLDVPAYFLIGRHDFNTPSTLVERFYQGISAPRGKRLIWFEEAAHDVFFDQPDALVKELIKITTEQEAL
jgi:pimeloyl-ACP methyl ester carboxylesterase